MVIMNIVWWMNLQVYDAFCTYFCCMVDGLCMMGNGCLYV
jgi:hypothetical protein